MNITKPTLIVTLLYKPNEAQDISDIYDALIKQLARPTEAGGLALSQLADPGSELWINREGSIFVAPIPLNELKHLELSDIAIIQVGINISAPPQSPPTLGGRFIAAVGGWCEAEERLAEALRGLPSGIEEAYVGRTIVYAASIAPDVELDSAETDELVKALLEQLRVQDKHYHLPHRALAASRLPSLNPSQLWEGSVAPSQGGKLWLLKTGRSGEDNIYMTLEPDIEEHPFKTTILFGNQALLLYPDTIAHKAYYMAREYTYHTASPKMPGEEDNRDKFRQASQELMQQTIKILAQKKSSPTTPTSLRSQPTHHPIPIQRSRASQYLSSEVGPSHSHHAAQLNNLSKQAATLTTVSSNLRQLYSRLKIHQFNYQLAQEQHAFGDISRYHEQQLKSILFRINEDLSDANATLDATNTALNYLRADYEREQAEISQSARQEAETHAAQKAKADERTQDYLAIMTVALTVAQIVGNIPIGWQLFWIIGSGIITWILIHRQRKRGGAT